MMKKSWIIIALVALASCRSPTQHAQSAPHGNQQSVTRDEAIRIANEASRKAMRIPQEVTPKVEETDNAFIITYPMTLSAKQLRAPDYYTRVIVDKKTGKITDFKVGS